MNHKDRNDPTTLNLPLVVASIDVEQLIGCVADTCSTQ